MFRFRAATALLIVAPLAGLAACADPATQSAAPAAQAPSPASTTPAAKAAPSTAPTTAKSLDVRTAKAASPKATSSKAAVASPTRVSNLAAGVYCGKIVDAGGREAAFTFQPWTYRRSAGAAPVTLDRKTVLLNLVTDPSVPVIEVPKPDRTGLQDVVQRLGLRQAMQLVGSWGAASFDVKVVDHAVVRISHQHEDDMGEGCCS